jgi:hypothetical protein
MTAETTELDMNTAWSLGQVAATDMLACWLLLYCLLEKQCSVGGSKQITL